MGYQDTREKAYFLFDSLRSRCNYPKHKSFPRYGGRGIRIRMTRKEFVEWYIKTAHGRTDLTVDRVDNNGHYELGNMQLISLGDNIRKASIESEAKRSSDARNLGIGRAMKNVKVRVGGNMFASMSEASRHLGKNRLYIQQRLKCGFSTLPGGELIEVLI